MEDIVKQGMKEMLEMLAAATARIETRFKSLEKIDSQFKEKSKENEKPRTEILKADGEIEAVEKSKVEEDSSEEQPKEKNGEESIKKKLEEEESTAERGVSKGKEVEGEEPVEEEKNYLEEIEETETKESSVKKANGKKSSWGSFSKVFKRCKRGKPLNPELFKEQRISGSPKRSSNDSRKSYLQKVSLVCLLDDTCGWKLFLELPDYELEGLGNPHVLFPKKIRWTFDPGL